MMMPVMDGRELLGHLSADPAWAAIPVIIMTAANLPVVDLKVRATIRKPFRAAQLLALIALI